MKFKISQAEFLKGLILGSKSLLTKANLPILSNILITARSKKIEVVTTDLETASRVGIDASVGTDGETTLLGRAVVEFVQQLDGGEITFEKLGEEAVITSGTYSARFATMDPVEFPAIPKIVGGKVIKINGSDLARAIAKISFCAAQDESRPILTGVLCEIVKNKMRFVATDGYRLGFCEVHVEGSDLPALLFIMPAKALVEVGKIIAESGGGDEGKGPQVTITVADNFTQAVFKVGEVEFTSRLIEGEFPNWQKIIPSEFVTKAVVAKVDLLRIIKMASIFARESGNIIKLNLEPGEKGKATLSVNAVTAQVGSASGSIDAKLDGKGGEIAFNYRYLLEVLGVFGGEDVVFEMNESLNPGKITGPQDNENFFHIIMPVRLQG